MLTREETLTALRERYPWTVERPTFDPDASDEALRNELKLAETLERVQEQVYQIKAAKAAQQKAA